MSEEQQKKVYLEDGGYQAKVDKPPGKPPTGGSAVKKPPSSEQKN
jgi:cysteine desulfurase